MVKAQVISMQSVAALRSWCSVKVIIIKRAADMCHMYAYLVGTAGARKYANHIYLMKLVEAAIEDTGLPICLHLDHGEDFEICKACVDGGFTSVMIDGSKHPFEENIELTKRVVEPEGSQAAI